MTVNCPGCHTTRELVKKPAKGVLCGSCGHIARKKGRSPQVKPTKYADKVPFGHSCKRCSKGIGKVNFRVNVHKDKYTVEDWCNTCRPFRPFRDRTSSKNSKVRLEKRKRLSERFELYFKTMAYYY